MYTGASGNSCLWTMARLPKKRIELCSELGVSTARHSGVWGTGSPPSYVACNRRVLYSGPLRQFFVGSEKWGNPVPGPLDAERLEKYLLNMKRMDLLLDEELLEETLRFSGEPTYSKAVTRAMTVFVRSAKARSLQVAGSGLWEGELARMRGDRRCKNR